MAIPTPDSLHDIVRPVPETSAAFITKLSAKMTDADTIKHSYRGGGLFTFYVEGYMTDLVNDEVRKALVDAGYQVHRIDQKAGYVPPAWYFDNISASHADEGVTGTAQTPYFVVSVSKKKVAE